jgi:hypothetical protein
MASREHIRYTTDGPARAEARIERDQTLVAEAVRRAIPADQLVALVLAGGYGRGEGGYRMSGEAFLPYNDYDYFVVVDGSRSAARRIAHELGAVAHALEERVGVEVDFALLRASRLPRLEFTLMYAELQHGHRITCGRDDALSVMRPMPIDRIPLSEFTRLMLNRGSLLLMNQAQLSDGGPRTADELEQFSRYLDKALLACADARLAATGRYDPSYVVKRRRLESLRWSGSRDFLRRYDRALAARTGRRWSLAPEEASSAQALVVADWLESLAELETSRLGKLPEWDRYASARIGKGQSAAGALGVLRNVAVTMRDFGPGEVFRNAAWALRYPRERLISVLPGLLQPDLGIPGAAIAEALSQPPGLDRATLAERFLGYWARYN